MSDAADSAIISFQNQLVEKLSKNNSMRRYLSLPISSDSFSTTLHRHGLYGIATQFEFDTISHILKAIPHIKRWSFWVGGGINLDYSPQVIDWSLGVDLLLHSVFSIRTGMFFYDYERRGDSYFSFNESRFITPESVTIINWGIFAQASYLFFGPRFFAEAGVGLKTIFGTGFTGRINIPGFQRFQPSGLIGLRYQPIFSGIGIGISYSPYFNSNGLQNHISFNEGFTF